MNLLVILLLLAGAVFIHNFDRKNDERVNFPCLVMGIVCCATAIILVDIMYGGT